jgi:hypothetical protein
MMFVKKLLRLGIFTCDIKVNGYIVLMDKKFF